MFKFSLFLRESVQTAGALIWRAVDAISKACFCRTEDTNGSLPEHVHMALIDASEGVGKLQHALVTMIFYKHNINKADQDKVLNLLLHHAYVEVHNWINEYENLTLADSSIKLLQIIQAFREPPHYTYWPNVPKTENSLLVSVEDDQPYNVNENVKNRFGTALGEIGFHYFNVIRELCYAEHVYVYELAAGSAATRVFYVEKPANLYKAWRRRHREKS